MLELPGDLLAVVDVDESIDAGRGRMVDRHAQESARRALDLDQVVAEPADSGLDVGVLFRLQVLEPAVVTRRGFFEPATPEVRQALRERAHAGEVPGITKASW